MKYLSLLVALLAVGSLSLGAQPKTDSLPTAPNAQITALQAEIADLKIELAEHRGKETYFSDILNAHIGLFGIVIGIAGVVFGLISWKTFPLQMRRNRKQAHDELETGKKALSEEFRTVMEEHQKSENKFIAKVNKDRVQLKNMSCNLSIQQAEYCDEKKDYEMAIFHVINSIVEDSMSKEFYASLDDFSQRVLMRERNLNVSKTALLGRFRQLKEYSGKISSISVKNVEVIKAAYEEFEKIIFYFDEDAKITVLRKEIVAKLRPLFDGAKKKNDSSVSGEV